MGTIIPINETQQYNYIIINFTKHELLPVSHMKFQSANKEAKRLAEKNPDQIFVILHACKIVKNEINI